MSELNRMLIVVGLIFFAGIGEPWWLRFAIVPGVLLFGWWFRGSDHD